jgi:NADH dehydrogenase
MKRGEKLEITLISDENFFLFSPLLHEVAAGAIETRHIAAPLRRLAEKDSFNFIPATVQRIDLEGRKVNTSVGTLDFDYLVLALGSVSDKSDLPSPDNNVFSLKTLRDSITIRNHIIAAFEAASIQTDRERRKQLLTFIVSGSGYTGVQLVADLRDFIFRYLTRYYKTIDPSEIRILAVEKKTKIISGLHRNFGAYIMRNLKEMGIEVKLKSRLTRVWQGGAEINGKEIVPASTIIWTSGVVANPRIAELQTQRDSLGRVVVNEYLELPKMPRVYAVGDCASFKDPVSGHFAPPRAHIAVRQAKVAAHNILAEVRGRNKKPYHYTDSAEMISLGASKGVVRVYNFRIYGLLARLIWIVAYSSLVTGRYNSIRIVMDWLLSRIFGRDITYLRLNEWQP